MLPPETARELGKLGHDAVNVLDVALDETSDDVIYEFAVAQDRTVVTENFSDFSKLVEVRRGREDPCVPVVFVRKRDFPRGGALATHLATHLDQWAAENPDPYPGPHWPSQ